MIETLSVPPRKSLAIFGKSPINVRKRSPYVQNNFGKSSEIFGKWSEIFGKSSKTSSLVCLCNRPFSKMAAENLNKSKLKTNTITRKSTLTLVRVQMNVVPRSTGNTNSGTRELTLKCKLKCYFKPMNNPLGVSPSKRKQGTTRGKEKIF